MRAQIVRRSEDERPDDLPLVVHAEDTGAEAEAWIRGYIEAHIGLGVWLPSGAKTGRVVATGQRVWFEIK